MQESCLACSYRITYPLYNSVSRPLAALNLPRSAEAARHALRFPMDFRVCAYCGHVFNARFDYYQVPYEDDSNLMYNRGPLWMEHLESLVEMLLTDYDAGGKTLVDIGCGDGQFLKLLLARNRDCRCIGFEPGIDAENARANGLSVHKDYFQPRRDLKLSRPDFLICRHVIEHLGNPREFVAAIGYWCNLYDLYPVFLAEVPRIDKAMRQGRVTDFLYEHVSNFTELSFRTMFETSGFEVLQLGSCYGDEVAVAVVRARRLDRLKGLRESAEAFGRRIQGQRTRVSQQLRALLRQGKSVAFWGGTGKGAAFLNAFGIQAEAFPLVVDSDAQKVGRYVPGTAQEIRSPAYLEENPTEVIVITTRWRAKDILEEIQRRGIPHQAVLVLEGEQLQPYGGEEQWASTADAGRPRQRRDEPHAAPGGPTRSQRQPARRQQASSS